MKRLALIACMVLHGGAVAQTGPGVHFIARELLGRPTSDSVTVSIMADRDTELYFQYGTKAGAYEGRTPSVQAAGKVPVRAVIGGLHADTNYYYRMRYREVGSGPFATADEHSFHTARPAGASFVFAVQADPHLDDGSDAAVYKQTLRNELAAKPDFLIDLGDTFMSDKLPYASYNEVEKRHLLARSYYELICHSVPLFLVLGNHEGETARRLDGTPENLAIWATKARKQFYANPEPNGFYNGSTKSEKFVGLRENYYAWRWGGALFVALDPYWYTTGGPGNGGDNWYWTLGSEQYDWLKRTLETSQAKFKFVFVHNLVGGLDLDGRARGGVEGAPYFEWGGHNADGSWGFGERRARWEMPIHQLLVKNNVNIFFHGHDHMYAKQDLDGIVYQEVPQPSHAAGRGGNRTAPYGYAHGDIIGGSGFLRIAVTPTRVNVEYVRSAGERQGGEVAHSYTLPVRERNDSVSPTTVAGSQVDPAPRQDDKGRRKGGRPLGKQPPPVGESTGPTKP